ncbi:MAG: transcription elongation factor GreA [Chloroflexota bacterium]
MATAAELLKGAGLLPDGPVRWGDPVRSGRPGVLLVELLAPVAQPPIDVSVCGKWAEKVETLRLDGERPDGKSLQRRLAAFWVPSATVLYVASTTRSLGGRVGALYANELGTRSPHPGGHWLKTLRNLADARIWWAETDAPEEAEDALLDAFAASVPDEERAALHDPATVLPFATLQSATGAKKETGLTGSLLPAPEGSPAARKPPAVRTRRTVLPAGSAIGAEESRLGRGGATARAPRSPRPSASGGTRSRKGAGASSGGTSDDAPRTEAAKLTAAGLERHRAELDDLRDVQRPANVQRIKTAREHGDLRENAEYQEARREQSFIEGRIQALEALVRNAEIVESAGGHEVMIGSTVVVEHDGERIEYAIVGSSEANPLEGRVSYVSPIGSALLGRRAGDEVVVAAPSGGRRYRVVEVR